ncbi:DUF2513 domain-containing protein [Streptococcus suis]|uniref:DUF2513 domain-containing protein n=1 Tax=Streptococcus suis TaxID=1307 RepID=A0A0Z8C6U5_STRSU|nr:DUF2513 domain-containing protein [Streptococcus suis]NQH93389.1 DUF2513 domain-containing protein [Streptococcus suis]CYU19790.1 Uncharacterised protein [Streptococcus suis]HEM4286579.1 DUF2513 domain-containing protein [Streptococcus suis]HEM5059108.1 DUF2513 domain-containing protein [Streptococcus suis]HEM5061363.1 DUF2513 domain-containing protein [Streptococcus suis]
MKFNPEIARDILLDIEELHQYPESFVFSASEKFNRAKKYDIDMISYHCDKLAEAGYIKWAPQYASDVLYIGFIDGLTYDGHQFLESVRSEKIWRETKARTKKMGVVTINILSQIASNIISEMINGPK